MYGWMYACVYGRIVDPGIDVHENSGRCHVYRWVHVNRLPSIDLNIDPCVCTSVYIWIHVFGTASRHARGACACGGCARACVASALGTITVPNASACPSCACGHAWSPSADSSTRSTPCLSIVRPHARAVRGRDIDSTKVKALPESLGQCKLLETLCVPRRRRRRRRLSRVCGVAGVCAAARACCVRRRALGRATWR